jgi:glycogen operon protein
MVNAFHEALEFELPDADGQQWKRWIDTALESPDDISSWQHAATVTTSTYILQAHSIGILFNQS